MSDAPLTTKEYQFESTSLQEQDSAKSFIKSAISKQFKESLIMKIYALFAGLIGVAIVVLNTLKILGIMFPSIAWYVWLFISSISLLPAFIWITRALYHHHKRIVDNIAAQLLYAKEQIEDANKELKNQQKALKSNSETINTLKNKQDSLETEIEEKGILLKEYKTFDLPLKKVREQAANISKFVKVANAYKEYYLADKHIVFTLEIRNESVFDITIYPDNRYRLEIRAVSKEAKRVLKSNVTIQVEQAEPIKACTTSRIFLTQSLSDDEVKFISNFVNLPNAQFSIDEQSAIYIQGSKAYPQVEPCVLNLIPYKTIKV